MQGPAAYASQQQSRKDQQFQNMLNMFFQAQQMKQKQGQQMWERGQAEKGWEDKSRGRDISERQVGAYEQSVEQRKPLPFEQRLQEEGMFTTQEAEIKTEAEKERSTHDINERIRLAKETNQLSGGTGKISSQQTRDIAYGVKVVNVLQNYINENTKGLPTESRWEPGQEGMMPTEIKGRVGKTPNILAAEKLFKITSTIADESQKGEYTPEQFKILTFIKANSNNPIYAEGIINATSEYGISLDTAISDYKKWKKDIK